MEYYDVRTRAARLRPISIVIGGRGIGKTYSALRYYLEMGKPFMYIRNTDKQMSLCATAFGNPFKKVCADLGRDVSLKVAGEVYVIRDNAAEKVIGYGAALSTFENLRGVDLSEVEYVLFDEFIENRKLTFDQGKAFLNFYETINRNRELEGRRPLVVLMLSNAQKLGNPILADLGLISVIEDMMRRGEEMRVTKDYFIELPSSAVSDAKAETALYRMAAGTSYAAEALRNEFANDSFYNVKKQPLSEYRPVVSLDGLFIYRHKSGDAWYICRSRATCQSYSGRDQMPAFDRRYGPQLRGAIQAGKVFFADFALKEDICNKLKV